jgi:hypothetical protein
MELDHVSSGFEPLSTAGSFLAFDPFSDFDPFTCGRAP